ncbi:hypothetical protein F441_08013 [Phytophthora nicotianae CJ01A1]|uniref:Uncharacterized protein n=2 Tax=Phytophthora nicotianae TaxID=4792 RepID=W2ZE81_PHYNI|nr:hypothetical protein F441_08013 [Phytophthora nicotianae CJ01A1]ETP45642.1 hypothetical protein F442_07980 [Phytophthora nicotianae P10297]
MIPFKSCSPLERPPHTERRMRVGPAGDICRDVLQKGRGDLLFERSRSRASANWMAQSEDPGSWSRETIAREHLCADRNASELRCK